MSASERLTPNCKTNHVAKNIFREGVSKTFESLQLLQILRKSIIFNVRYTSVKIRLLELNGRSRLTKQIFDITNARR